jgi:hypothetical protein
MQRKKLPLPSGAKLLSVVCVLLTTRAAPAFAHVKWFSPYHIAEQPTHLSDVLSPLFVELALLSVFILWCASAVESTRLGVWWDARSIASSLICARAVTR